MMMADGTLRRVARLFEGASAGQGDGPLLARFVEGGDERAFEALVDRHGSMVWATCRAVLRDPHDAEDAFQAAFVALARRSRTVRRPEALGAWLHRVAYREAVRVGTEASRRRASERAAARDRPDRGPDPEPDDGDLRAAILAELDRLPEAYRQPLVLCDLEGLTKGEAAHRLGWTEGSVRGRLERARVVLRGRLARRGLGASAGAAVAALGREASAAVSAARVAGAVRAALAAAPGVAGASAWLAALPSIRLGVAAALLGSIGLVVMGRGPAAGPPGTDLRQAPAPIPTPGPIPAQSAAPEGSATLAGRVVDPDGEAVAGARVYLPMDWERPDRRPARPEVAARPEPRARTGFDGRFRFSVERDDPDPARAGAGSHVLALADGFGPTSGPAGEPGREPTLTLARDDAPIEGRVVDLEGRPVAGVSVRVASVQVPKTGTLDAWIEEARLDRKAWSELSNALLGPDLLRGSGLGPKATTDASGRFRLLGIGRERIVTLVVEGPTIRSSLVHALTRKMPDLLARAFPRQPLGKDQSASLRATIHGRSFTHASAPTRPIVGTVRDKATGLPLPGVTIQGWRMADGTGGDGQIVRATADAQGRFRLVGMPRGPGNQIFAEPPAGMPAFGSIVEVAEGPPGTDPVTLDVALEHGVAIRGRVVDRATGKPVRAEVHYHAFRDNPHLDLGRDRFPFQERSWSGADGSFMVVGLAGRGLVSASGPLATDGEPIFLPVAASRPKANADLMRQTIPEAHLELISGFAEVAPGEGDAGVSRDIAVDSGRRLAVRAVGEDGVPLAGARFSDTSTQDWKNWRTRPEADLSIRVASRPDPEAGRDVAALLGASPTRMLLFRHEARRLAGSVAIRGDEAGPVAVPLRPWASVRGRLVDARGEARPWINLAVEVADALRLPGVVKPRPANPMSFEFDDAALIPARVQTDDDGRFRVEGLIPGASHWIFLEAPNRDEGYLLGDALTPRAGDDLDLGDLKARPGP